MYAAGDHVVWIPTSQSYATCEKCWFCEHVCTVCVGGTYVCLTPYECDTGSTRESYLSPTRVPRLDFLSGCRRASMPKSTCWFSISPEHYPPSDTKRERLQLFSFPDSYHSTRGAVSRRCWWSNHSRVRPGTGRVWGWWWGSCTCAGAGGRALPAAGFSMQFRGEGPG